MWEEEEEEGEEGKSEREGGGRALACCPRASPRASGAHDAAGASLVETDRDGRRAADRTARAAGSADRGEESRRAKRPIGCTGTEMRTELYAQLARVPDVHGIWKSEAPRWR